MEHSKKYAQVRLWYSRRMWDETRVQNAVEKGWITQAEFEEITGKTH